MNCIHFCGNVTLELTFNWFPPGVLMFISGMAINIHSDYILRNLRKPGEVSYKIPTGQCIQYLILNFEGHSWKSHSEKQKNQLYCICSLFIFRGDVRVDIWCQFFRRDHWMVWIRCGHLVLSCFLLRLLHYLLHRTTSVPPSQVLYELLTFLSKTTELPIWQHCFWNAPYVESKTLEESINVSIITLCLY